MMSGNIFGGIKKNVIVLGIASLFTDISSEMLYPVVPIFLTSVLCAPMSVVGLIEGIAESTASVLKVFSGRLSDTLKKRRALVISGYFLSSLSKLIFFFSYTWHFVLLGRFADRLGKGVRTSPRDAMIADSTDASHRGKAFGLHRAMDSIGACIGPLVAIWFLSVSKGNIRPVFLIAFIPAIIAVLTLAFFLKESSPAAGAKQEKPISFDLKQFPPNFRNLLMASSVFAVGNSSDAFLIVRSKDLGLSVTMVMLAYVLYNIIYSLFSMPLGALSDKMPRKTVMVIGYLIFAASYVGFGIVRDPRFVWILFPVYGFYIAMTDGVGKALVSDMVEPGIRGTALGLYHFTLGIFTFFASFVAGLLWTHVGAGASFLYGATMAVLSSIAILLFVK